MKKLIAVASMAAALAVGLGACGSSGSDNAGSGTQTHKAAKKTSDPCITASDYDKCAGSTPLAEDKPTKAHDEKPGRVKRAHKIEKKLDVMLPCNWKKQTNGTVHVEICNKHQMLLATSGKDEDYAGTAPKHWVDGVAEQSSGWALLGNRYAVISPDHGVINQAYDLLGANGTVKSFG